MKQPLHFRQLGGAHLPPLLLIHGDLANGRHAWKYQLESLSDAHRLIVPDRRGYGNSPEAPRPYTVASEADDMADLADMLGLEAFHLVGHSYGGLIAIELAGRMPERILSLHLIEPPYFDLLADDPQIRSVCMRFRRIFENSASLAAEQIAEAFFGALLDEAALQHMKSLPVWTMLAAEGKRLVHTQFPGDYPSGALQLLEHYTGIIQIYTGGRSHPVLRRLAAVLSQRIPASRLIDIPDAYHDVQRVHQSFDPALLAVTRGE